MEKVMCIKCGNIGFTAAPKYVRCSCCGGRHKVVPYNKVEFAKGVIDNAYLDNILGTFSQRCSG